MDAADREREGGHGHRVETPLLPLKKMASNYGNGPGRISAVDGDPYASPSKKKQRMAEDRPDTKDIAGALEHPVPRRRRTVPAAAPREPIKKLMHDGIRSFVPQPQLRDDDDDDKHRRHATAAADVPLPLPLPGPAPVLSAALERRLAELGATTRPWLVHSKALHKSDVDENQNRLLVSCKRGGSGGTDACPITRCFSAAERARVNQKHAGLWVTALDRGGGTYALTCKFLGSNNGYRFITEWKDFLTRNGMNLSSQRHRLWTRDVEVELWGFRSHHLPFQPQIDAYGKVVTETVVDGDGKMVTVVQRISHHLDPQGGLGLILLLHENRRRRVVKDEEEEEEEDDDDDDDWKKRPSSVARKKGKGKQQKSSGKRGGASPASVLAQPVAPPAPVAEQGGARRSEEPTMFYAAVGLAKLRESICKRWQEHVDRGNGVAKSPADVEGEKIDKRK